jgi:hypothetical protein
MLSLLQSRPLPLIITKSSSGPEMTSDGLPVSTAQTLRNILPSKLGTTLCDRFFFLIEELLHCAQEAYIWRCAVGHQYGIFRGSLSIKMVV